MLRTDAPKLVALLILTLSASALAASLLICQQNVEAGQECQQLVQERRQAILRLVEDRERCLGPENAELTLRQACHFASTLRRHARTEEEEQLWCDLATALVAEYCRRYPAGPPS